MFVPVIDKNRNPLMPTTPARARKWMKSGKATPFFRNGVFCVRLNVEPSATQTQDIAVGIDSGSKKEGFTVKSEKSTYLNVQTDAHNKVSQKVDTRRQLRRGRRSRKCPNRKNRTNRMANKQRLPAGTRTRWDWKLRILNYLSTMFPITHVCVEDIKAQTQKGARHWNESFSPLEVGKQWFYAEIQKRWILVTLKGFETKAIRDSLGLQKAGNKMSSDFNAHCVDSWCLAYHVIGSDADQVDNTCVFYVSPIPIARRQLHRQNSQKGGRRPRYGGTMCNGIAKNTLVKHVTHGLTRVSGYMEKKGYSLYSLGGKRLTQSAKRESFKILTRLNFNYI